MKWIKPAIWTVVAALAVGSVAWFAWPKPVPVDLATVALGPMEVTINDEARTNIRHVYTVSAPVTGKVLRISSPESNFDPSMHVGDVVTADETVVAFMQPTLPALLDARSRNELEAASAAAEAAVRLGEAEVQRVEALLGFSRAEHQRAEALATASTIPAKALQAAELDVAVNEAALESAKAQLEVRRSEHTAAVARLMGSSSIDAIDAACCIEIRAPATGVILKITQQSEGVTVVGTPLLEIGEPRDLEIVADLLSTAAVQIKQGASVRIDGWGGQPLQGRVARVEPDGFAKVSALGIEEQRVRTVIDFLDPPEAWSTLGNSFRVIVHISLWSTDSALTVPVPALFRHGEDWAVFTVSDGIARETVVEVDHRNERVAEVISGLEPGDRVILHPNDKIKDGVAVAEREVR
jgi:HlyD family secretion protein